MTQRAIIGPIKKTYKVAKTVFVTIHYLVYQQTISKAVDVAMDTIEKKIDSLK